MSTYVDLGPRGAVTGQPDNTGNNPGNWTVTFDPATLNFTLPFVEIYHIVISGAAGSSFTLWIDVHQWDGNQQGFINSWDPAQPITIRPGQYVYFYWSDPVTDNNPPTVTIWMRYDQDIQANARMLPG
jgi:hypothetical protein